MADIALLDPGTSFAMRQQQNPALCGMIQAISMYDLPNIDISRFSALIIPGLSDQEFLYRERGRIRAFLDGGRVLAFSGHLFRPWLPGGSHFVPKVIRSFRDYTVRIASPHQIFAGVLPEDLTFRKGVAGFFARGYHPLPVGAEVLLTLADGEPILYVDRQSTRGTILVHAGNDLLGYAGDQTTAGRLVPQFLEWLGEESRRLQESRSTS